MQGFRILLTTQTFQTPLPDGCTLNHIRDPTECKVYSLIKGFLEGLGTESRVEVRG